MSKNTLATGTSPFAHLMAGFRGKRAEEDKPEDDEARKARRAEEDQKREEEDARRAEEDERRQEEDARRAEEDGDDDADASAGDGDDEDQDPEKDAEDSDPDDDDLDEKGKKAFRRGLALGRARENARCARIFADPAAAGRAALAATLAFTTRNTSAAAARIMKATGAEAPEKPRGRSLDSRMGSRTEARPGSEGGKSNPSFAEKSLAVMRKLGRA